MAARQKHGFDNEKKIIGANGLRSAKGYTNKWDAYADIAHVGNMKYYDLPVQIKTIRKGGSVDMGDVFRHSKTDQDFILHVEFYDKKDKTKIMESHILYIQ